MRIATLVLAILGGLISAALAIKWLSDASDLKSSIELARAAGIAGEINSIIHAAYGLLVAAALGLTGGILTMKGKGKIAAVLFAVAIVIPAVFTGKTLVGTFLFVIAAVLALVARPPQARHAVG